MATTRIVRRGHIFWYNLKPEHGGSLMKGMHPILITSNNLCNKNSTVLTAVIITSQMGKTNLPTHVMLEKQYIQGLPVDSVVQCEQIVSIIKNNLGDYIGNVDSNTMKFVDEALNIQQGIGDTKYVKMLKDGANKIMETINFNMQLVNLYKNTIDKMIIDQAIMKIRIEKIRLENYCNENRLNFSEFYKNIDDEIILGSRSASI